MRLVHTATARTGQARDWMSVAVPAEYLADGKVPNYLQPATAHKVGHQALGQRTPVVVMVVEPAHGEPAYAKGTSIATLAHETGTSLGRIRLLLLERGVARRPRGGNAGNPDLERTKRAKSMAVEHKSGTTLAQLAQTHGISATTARNLGARRRRRPTSSRESHICQDLTAPSRLVAARSVGRPFHQCCDAASDQGMPSKAAPRQRQGSAKAARTAPARRVQPQHG